MLLTQPTKKLITYIPTELLITLTVIRKVVTYVAAM